MKHLSWRRGASRERHGVKMTSWLNYWFATLNKEPNASCFNQTLSTGAADAAPPLPTSAAPAPPLAPDKHIVNDVVNSVIDGKKGPATSAAEESRGNHVLRIWRSRGSVSYRSSRA